MDKYWLHIVFALYIVVSTARAAEIVDPERHFLADRSQEKTCLWRLQADLNADQLPEELLTLENYRNGKAGHIWQVYIGTKSGFKVAGELISFRTDAVFTGHIQEIDGPGLLAYFPASSSRGALVSFQVKQGRLVETSLGQIRPQGSDAAMYQRYFGFSRIVVEKKPLLGGECGKI